MKKAYAYVRVSGKSQIDGHGFERQAATISSFAENAGIEIVKVYKENGVSGTTDEADRPAFQEMIAAILKNGVRVIIVEGLDRLAREYRIQESLLIYLASKGITLINARTGENVTDAILDDPMKKALIQIQGVFAELEKSMLVKKLKEAREAKRAENGKCEGRKSYSEASPDILDMLRSLRRKPKAGKRRTYKEIAAIMNSKGIRTQTGKEWTAGNVAVILSTH